MTKPYVIIAITAAASILCIALPGIVEHLGEGLHFATIIVSGHHIVEEIGHSFRSQKMQQGPT